jgi:hypothetical protein
MYFSGASSSNTAVQDLSLSLVTVSGESGPTQSPCHSENVPTPGVSVTSVSTMNSASQVSPQSIPAGSLVTLPKPVTKRVSVCFLSALSRKTAAHRTVRNGGPSASPRISYSSVSEVTQVPTQLSKNESSSASAVSSTSAFSG